MEWLGDYDTSRVPTTEETTDPETGKPFRYIDLATAHESVQKPMLKLDESMYYDMLSAFIKSMRGSDPDAALLWFARLMYAGVDPKLIVRRIIVHASEDVGLADPTAMLQAHAAANALEVVGMPEARIPIAQAIIDSFEKPLHKLLMAVAQAIKSIPLDSVEKVFKKGVLLTGGGAMIHGMDLMMSKVLGINVVIPDSPIDSVAKGLSLINTKIPVKGRASQKNVTDQVSEYYKDK